MSFAELWIDPQPLQSNQRSSRSSWRLTGFESLQGSIIFSKSNLRTLAWILQYYSSAYFVLSKYLAFIFSPPWPDCTQEMSDNVSEIRYVCPSGAPDYYKLIFEYCKKSIKDHGNQLAVALLVLFEYYVVLYWIYIWPHHKISVKFARFLELATVALVVGIVWFCRSTGRLSDNGLFIFGAWFACGKSIDLKRAQLRPQSDSIAKTDAEKPVAGNSQTSRVKVEDPILSYISSFIDNFIGPDILSERWFLYSALWIIGLGISGTVNLALWRLWNCNGIVDEAKECQTFTFDGTYAYLVPRLSLLALIASMVAYHLFGLVVKVFSHSFRFIEKIQAAFIKHTLQRNALVISATLFIAVVVFGSYLYVSGEQPFPLSSITYLIFGQIIGALMDPIFRKGTSEQKLKLGEVKGAKEPIVIDAKTEKTAEQ